MNIYFCNIYVFYFDEMSASMNIESAEYALEYTY